MPTESDEVKSAGAVPANGPAKPGFPTVAPASALGRGGAVAPSNRITMGCIGVGNEGTSDMKRFLKDERVQVLAVCDPNRESAGYWDGAIGGRAPAMRYADKAAAERAGKTSYTACAGYEDFRDVLARDDIQAVTVCTPDHWHAIQCVMAAMAGKDIFCQKPLSLTVVEGRAIADAVKKYNVVFQTGSQQRSDPFFRTACEWVRNGRIGKLHTARCGMPGGRPDLGKTADRKAPEKVPEGFNYDLWLGPAPEAPYAPARCHVNFRWIFDYSGGQVTDWGGHHPDCAQWGMGTELTGPIEIRNQKAEFPPDPLWNTATEYYFEAIFENGVKMIISDKEQGGVRWQGEDGWVWADRHRIGGDPSSMLDTPLGPDEVHLYRSANHWRNFVDCIISREPTVAPAEIAHRSITISHLGNIAMRLGREKLRWDPAKEQIIGDAEASKMLSREYRAPWKLPDL
jgi:predicted dehydrogenase